MTFGGGFGPVFRPVFDPGVAVATPPAAWYAGLTVAYQPKGAASYAASKVNLANPGTYDAGDGAAYPTWASGTGWSFNGTDQYLTTGIVHSANWSLIVRINNAVLSDIHVIVGFDQDGASRRLWISLYSPAGYANGTTAGYTPIASGVLAVTNFGYKNGVVDSSELSWDPGDVLGSGAYIGAYNAGASNTPAFFYAGDIIACAWADRTLTAGEIATLSTAMAAL